MNYNMNLNRTPVYLNIYDFTTMNDCLKYLNLPAFHCGVEINNLQYCYSVVDSHPDVTGVVVAQPQTAEYRFNKKLFLGNTHLSYTQIENVIDELSLKYTCGKYHMFANNCNHFCNEFVKILLGSGIPYYLFTTTNCLNRICCCLPIGFVSGLWAIQQIQAQQMKQQAALLQHQ